VEARGGQCGSEGSRADRFAIGSLDAQRAESADALALAVRDGALGSLRVERADGAAIQSTPLGTALATAGFHVTPRGLRLRA
jgi:ATP-dependent Lhr-like helicase